MTYYPRLKDAVTKEQTVVDSKGKFQSLLVARVYIGAAMEKEFIGKCALELSLESGKGFLEVPVVWFRERHTYSKLRKQS